MSVLSTLVIDLKGNSAHFQKELKKANAKSKSFAQKVRANSATVVKSLGAIGTLGAVALGAIYKQSSANIDALAKQADKLGLTTEALGGLRHAAELSGVSATNMDLSLQRMTRRLSEAAKGGGSAAKAVKELGLDAKELAALSPDQAFIKITKAMEGVENQSDKVRLAFKFFDSGGVGLVNTMGAGADALKKTIAEAETLGATVNRIDAAKIEMANDAMFRGEQATKGFGNAITVELAPFVKTLGDEFYNSALEAGGFGEWTSKAMNVTIQAVGYAANVIHGLKAVWIGVKLAATVSITGILELLELADQAVTNMINKMPGVEAKTSAFIGGMADAFRSQIGELQTEFEDFANMPLPHDGIVELVAEVQRKTQAAAVEIVQNTPAALLPPPEEQASIGVVNDGLPLNEEKLEQQKGYWDQLSTHISNTTQDFDTMWGNTFDRFAQGIGDATASAIMDGKNFGDTMKAFAKSMVKEVLSGLIQIAVKKLALAAIDKMITTTGAATNVATAAAAGTSMAAAYAPAAAAASLASFGGNSVPAMAGIGATYALTEGLALAGMAHDGIDSIPSEGTWLLDKGERVVDKRTNQDLKQALKVGGMGGGKVTVNLIEDAQRAGQASQGKGLNDEDVIRIFVADIRQGGDTSDAMELTYGLQRTGT